MSSDFEELLNRLDSDDQETRQRALEELEAIFRGPHPPRFELRQQIRALLDRWDADEAGVALDAQPVGHEQTRRPRAVKEGRVSPEERESSDAKPDSSEEAAPREDRHDSQRAGVAARDDAQPRGEPPSRRREELASLHGSLSGRPRPDPQFDDDRTFLGEVARPFFERREDNRNELPIAESVDRAWGAAVFTGTRVPVDAMFEYLEAGDGLGEFLLQFPTVDRSKAVAVLDLARSAVQLAVQNAETRAAAPSREDLQNLAGLRSREPGREEDCSEHQEETEPDEAEQVAVGVRFTKRHFWVELAEGWELRVPTGWFPWLTAAKRKQRFNVVITAGGRNLRWPDLDGDLGGAFLVHGFARAKRDTRHGGRRTRLPSMGSLVRDRRMDRVRDRAWESFALSEGNPDPIQAHRIQRPPGTRMSDEKLADIEASHLGPLPEDLSDQAVARYLDAIDDIAALVSEVWRSRAGIGQRPVTVSEEHGPDGPMAVDSSGSFASHPQEAVGPPDLETEFEERLRDGLESGPTKAKDDSRWLRDLVDAYGGVAAARIWLSLDRHTRMGRKSAARGRLDATINRLVLETEFEPLFTARERTIARHHLTEKGRRLRPFHPPRS